MYKQIGVSLTLKNSKMKKKEINGKKHIILSVDDVYLGDSMNEICFTTEDGECFMIPVECVDALAREAGLGGEPIPV